MPLKKADLEAKVREALAASVGGKSAKELREMLKSMTPAAAAAPAAPAAAKKPRAPKAKAAAPAPVPAAAAETAAPAAKAKRAPAAPKVSKRTVIERQTTVALPNGDTVVKIVRPFGAAAATADETVKVLPATD